MRADRTIIKRYGLNGQPCRIPRFWGKLGELEESSEKLCIGIEGHGF